MMIQLIGSVNGSRRGLTSDDTARESRLCNLDSGGPRINASTVSSAVGHNLSSNAASQHATPNKQGHARAAVSGRTSFGACASAIMPAPPKNPDGDVSMDNVSVGPLPAYLDPPPKKSRREGSD